MSSKTRSPHFHVIEYIYNQEHLSRLFSSSKDDDHRSSKLDRSNTTIYQTHTHTHTQLTLKLRSLLHRRASGGFLNIKIITIIPKSN